jgi:Cu+-exporting ATPase
VPLTLAFDRRDDSRCTDEVVLKDFGIRRKLSSGEVTEIRIVPDRTGRFAFVCGMGMLEGTIVVDPVN